MKSVQVAAYAVLMLALMVCRAARTQADENESATAGRACVHRYFEETRGTLSREVTWRLYSKHLDEIRGCYQKELALQPTLGGRFKIRFRLTPTGVPTRIAVRENSVKNTAMQNCVLGRIKSFQFPAVENSETVTITLGLEFKRCRDKAPAR